LLAFVTVWKFGDVPDGQFVPSKRQTAMLFIFVSTGKRTDAVTARFVDVVFVPVAFVHVISESVNGFVTDRFVIVPFVTKRFVDVTDVPVPFVNVMSPSVADPTTWSVDDGAFVPMPRRFNVSSKKKFCVSPVIN
jgi:hypothetical protein